ncbi:MAG: AAA family ATPase [Patescibacteria group bacterium]|nr:AAA family ATPase [Patescibacteria group bacterium]
MVNIEQVKKNLDLFVGTGDIKDRLFKELSGSTHQAYLLVGPDYVGKGFLAKLLAANFLNIDWVQDLSHPDLVIFNQLLEKNASSAGEKQWKQSVNDLIHSIHLSPVISKYRVAVIQNIDSFSPQALNALLKTLEEPPEKAVIIMTAVDKDSLLPTILSRVQILRLNFLPDSEIKKWLSGQTMSNIDELTLVSNGRISLAMRLLKDKELAEIMFKGLKDFKDVADKDLFKSMQLVNIKDREKSLNLIGLWLNLIRRIWLAQLGSQSLPDSFKDYLGRYSNEELVAFIKKLQEAKLAVIKNANARIALEDVVVSSLI